MAEGVTPEPGGGKELEPTTGSRELEQTHSKELAPYTPRISHGHETKFRMTYAVLAGVGLAAVAAAVIFLAAGKPPRRVEQTRSRRAAADPPAAPPVPLAPPAPLR